MNASLLSAQCLGSTMDICFILSQIPGCSQSWCYSYTRNSKGPLDQLLKVTITHEEYWAQNHSANYLIWNGNRVKAFFTQWWWLPFQWWLIRTVLTLKHLLFWSQYRGAKARIFIFCLVFFFIPGAPLTAHESSILYNYKKSTWRD